jgi:hypothetical protein
MSYRSFKAQTRGTPGETVWIMVNQICAVIAGIDGLAQVFTLDGKTHFLTERADVVVRKLWGAEE